MKIDIDVLIETLEKSVERNGEKPLTNKWLLNIMWQVNTQQELDEEYHAKQDMAADYYAEDWGDRS